MDFFIAFTAIGILQVIGALMALLLPNEEATGSGECGEDCVGGGPTFKSPCADYSSFRSTRGISRPSNKHTGGSGNSYGCCCPICKEIGCIPECEGCVPGGLAGVSPTG